ncbi:UDP-N-acetylglucosamine 1-carboxyvinyltransferase [Tistrella bauzanensis]|uniref:UDP-N-acetylglucosamine 1-carboxyvinyltransferase n=1 Tax=Tistrella bauzanensis TaxID=657419 RepID=A0ABQ1IXU4_9PROT|nr:UDP-N-acetylglucosamine 1-carboxyvinyltransferase [Tistrella bauzanensis]GGB52843.1 UDP-N-acetylglucosamine 1-carboxyvinyltransferase [Tistrella bauzanensis]
MDSIRIRGGRPLEGIIPIGGAKNAALPLLAAGLLTADTLTLTNLPHLADITTMVKLLAQHGVVCTMNGGHSGGHEGRVLALDAGQITNTTAPYDLVRKMRASILVLGPMLARVGEAQVSLPGGCAIGTRPVDLHLKGLEDLGAVIELEGGYIRATAPRGLKGAHIRMPFVSVGATENLLMAASLADGTTILDNAAREPEIGDLVRCLTAMGARIEGIDTETLTIHGVARLHGAEHSVLPDRIEAGTYAIAGAITGGDVELTGLDAALIASVLEKLEEAGARITVTDRGVRIVRDQGPLRGADVMTQVYPGFPTDMQAQFMALMTVAEGAAMVTETIFENRFMHVPELHRMGANIVLHGASALVRGVPKLTGAPVMATDLRASSSLVLAGLAARGETVVSRVYHLDRGYENIEAKLAACGADITRLTGGA